MGGSSKPEQVKTLSKPGRWMAQEVFREMFDLDRPQTGAFANAMRRGGHGNEPWEAAFAQALSPQLSEASSLDPGLTADYFLKGVTTPAIAAWNKYRKPQERELLAGAGGTLFHSRVREKENEAFSEMTMNLNALLAQNQMQNMRLQAQAAQRKELVPLQAAQAFMGTEQRALTTPSPSPWASAGLGLAMAASGGTAGLSALGAGALGLGGGLSNFFSQGRNQGFSASRIKYDI